MRIQVHPLSRLATDSCAIRSRAPQFRNPVSDRIHTANKETMASTMISKWCERSLLIHSMTREGYHVFLTSDRVHWPKQKQPNVLCCRENGHTWTFKLREISGCFRRPLRFAEFQWFSYNLGKNTYELRRFQSGIGHTK